MSFNVSKRVSKRESLRARAGLFFKVSPKSVHTFWKIRLCVSRLELAFQNRYGRIVAHEWFGDGFMMLGFSEGFLVVISTHISEIGISEHRPTGQFALCVESG